MEKQSQAPIYARPLEVIPNDSQKQILVLREDELQQIAGGRGRTAGFFCVRVAVGRSPKGSSKTKPAGRAPSLRPPTRWCRSGPTVHGQLMGAGYVHGPELADRLPAAAHKDGATLVAIDLDAIGVDVHQQSTNLAERISEDRHCEG